jgi:glutamine synthetase
LPYFASTQNIALFEKHGVFKSREIHSRLEILLKNYVDTINIEAHTMIDVVNRKIIPSIIKYQNLLVKLLCGKQNLGATFSTTFERTLLERISNLSDVLYKKLAALYTALNEVNGDTLQMTAMLYREKVITAMNELRTTVDELETIMPQEYWSLPVYSEILYSVI